MKEHRLPGDKAFNDSLDQLLRCFGRVSGLSAVAFLLNQKIVVASRGVPISGAESKGLGGKILSGSFGFAGRRALIGSFESLR